MCQVKAIQWHCTLQWSDSTNYCEESRGWFLSMGEGQRSWWQNCLRIEYVEKLHFRQRTCRSLGRKENEIFRWNGFGGSSSILFRIVKHTAMSVDPFSSHLFSPHPLLMLCQKLNLRTESKMLGKTSERHNKQIEIKWVNKKRAVSINHQATFIP